MKKKVNYYKIGALILMTVEAGIILCVDENAIKDDITLWRLYIACVLFIPMNIIFIATKQKRRVRK